MFSTIFSPIEALLTTILNTLYHLTELAGFGSYGLAIILLTVLMKIILYPLTVKQLESMKAMQQIQPKLQRLQEKYKDNPQLLQQKMLKLYQDAGVNPAAGCLPMLAQMPILMAMYYTLFNYDFGGVTPSFLWLPNLSQPDPTYLLPLLSALSTFVLQKLSAMPTPSNQQSKIFLIIMPIFIGWISLNFPAGLVLYWITMNVVQMAQQFWVYRDTESKEVS
ncbi:MAG: membrane protein insertase YidC [Selenomonadaceae bacterium]|nr:membrane protein insertase YidC [Selenomonadaceae bacterium]MBQ7629490.1 membrane protein insertase YidC [Selenomonadaceae bacterium]